MYFQKNTIVHDSDANGRTMITAQTGIITIEIIPRDLVSSSVKNIVQMIKTVDHLNGHGTTVRGGSAEYVRVNLTLQKVTPIIGLAEKNVS